MSDIQLDALAIAAHRDDIEITSGGLMIKFADLGYKIGALDFTRGEMGSNGDADMREREADAAASVMGLTVRENLGLPDANVEFSRENVLKVVQVLREYRPRLVILPHSEQRHPDHFHCYEIAKEACYFAGLRKLDCEGEPYRPHKILFSTYYRDVEPSFVVDISDQFERKIEAIKCYASQFDPESSINQIFVPGIDVFEYVRTRDRTYGMQIRKHYAEPYVITEQIAIDDPLKMPTASI
jgi:bacillithiol biosynthesis deacetylase BshB1